jgi:hypothetical protein
LRLQRRFAGVAANGLSSARSFAKCFPAYSPSHPDSALRAFDAVSNLAAVRQLALPKEAQIRAGKMFFAEHN